MMQSQELSDLMQASAQDAKIYAAEQHQISLEGDLASLSQVDQLLSQLHTAQQTKAHSSEMLFTLCNIMGAYVGEIFIHNVGGHWQSNNIDQTAPYMAVGFGDKEFPFASVCYHKITNDNSISLQAYVQQAKQNAMQ
ncbi:hypothetical protein GCM10010919_20430 [Alishewanella longhuensis]|uniref:DUF3806 domain-containing protein n=1 Tax=Alishewanella longhuensis TaxID=1091037 RepID=A0ABQ3KYA7_9ALTE|nr:hypothetical protein [Alishewanella longhuensis]GHG70049.1 hypothetical protein GCM10010919_20430 [Alishewanella longhuensis]